MKLLTLPDCLHLLLQVFDEVIRATSKTKGFVKMPECYVNLGNVWLARQQYNDALKMYQHASKMHNHKSPQVSWIMYTRFYSNCS